MTRTRATILASSVCVIAATIFFVTLAHAIWYAPDSEIALPQSAATASSSPTGVADASEPQRLRIPSIAVDAGVQYVGVTKKGTMGTPNNFTDVAWYKYGTVPGQVGSAVIDGHVDNGLGLDGVFKRLSDVKVGDAIYVDTKAGSTLRFAVTDVESYPYQSVPTDQIFNPKDAVRLNLITCEGSWVPGDKTYDHRLVVYAKLVQP